jgi:predicted ATPase
MIRRVRIQGYKSLKNIEIQLQPLTVIIGPNAAGKSNLFDALGLLSRCVTSRTLSEAFERHRGTPVETFYREKGLDWLLTQPNAQFTIEVDVELPPEVVEIVDRRLQEIQSGQTQGVSETRLRYTLTVEMTMDSGHLGVQEERLVALNQEGTEKTSLEPFIQRLEKQLLPRIEGRKQSYSQYFVGQDYTVASTSFYLPHHPHLAAFKEELSRWRFYYLDPETLRAENPLKEAEVLGSFGSDLAAFYNTLRARNPRQFETLNRALSLLLPEVQELSVKKTQDGLLQLLVLEHKVSYSAGVISEGTLRVLALLAITNALAPTTVIGYEEPENGVHPRRLRLIAELLQNTVAAGKQVLVNTHSPQLPEYFEPTSLVICRKGEGRCCMNPQS